MARQTTRTADLTLTELFNDAALGYIISNFNDYTFRPDTDTGSTLTMIKKYRATASSPGYRSVPYYRAASGHGRLFAQGSLSLQAMPREIRDAISFEVYHDVDMVNAHPQLLLQFCEKHNLACSALRHYCNNRSTVLAELEPDACKPAHAKQAVLAVINGGDASPERRGVMATAWLQEFAAEMARVREAALRIPDGAKYLDLAKGKRVRGSNTSPGPSCQRAPNLYGSAINMLLCDLEHDALMAMYEYFEKQGRHVDVLVFDGCMVRKSPCKGELTAEILQHAADHIYTKTGYRIQLVVKDMAADMLLVPEDVRNGFSVILTEPRYAVDDHAAGRLFLDDLKDVVRSCNGRVFVKASGAWTDAPEVSTKTLMELCLQANIFRITTAGDVGPMSGNVPSASRIITAAQALMPDDPMFEEKLWYSSIGCICYLDGLWDFQAGRFFTYAERPDVYPAHVIPRGFPVERPCAQVTAAVDERLLLSSLGSDDMVQTYLEIIARATAGEYTDKQWVIMVGERNCGKGMLQELNTATWGLGNVNTVLANAFLMQSHAAQDAAKALSWALDCRLARQSYTNEVKVDTGNRFIKLDGNAVKQFQSGGDVLLGRKNHQNERSFRIASKLIMNLNDIPTISPIDAIANMLMIKFPFKFVSEADMLADPQPFYKLRDDTIKSFCRQPEVVDAFTWLVIDAYKSHPVVPCAKVLADTEEYRTEAGDDLMLVRNSFQITQDRDDIVTNADLRTFSSLHQLSCQKVKDRLERMGAKPDKNCCLRGQILGRGYRFVRSIAPVN